MVAFQTSAAGSLGLNYHYLIEPQKQPLKSLFVVVFFFLGGGGVLLSANG